MSKTVATVHAEPLRQCGLLHWSRGRGSRRTSTPATFNPLSTYCLFGVYNRQGANQLDTNNQKDLTLRLERVPHLRADAQTGSNESQVILAAQLTF